LVFEVKGSEKMVTSCGVDTDVGVATAVGGVVGIGAAGVDAGGRVVLVGTLVPEATLGVLVVFRLFGP
jgi:hypothetical protein